MSFYLPPWNSSLEPNQGNIKQWLDNLYSKFMPIEQARWNESQIDSMFYAGNQSFINRNFNFSHGHSAQNYYFNLIKTPLDMVTGYERQHRKSFMYQATEGADNQTTDQYTKLITHICNAGDIHEQKSKAKELAAISGMCLMQPYLDFTEEDPLQGELKVKIWEYNSFLVDPYFRSPDMSDCQWVWCQEYISKQEVEDRFPHKKNLIQPMAGSPQNYGSFYFLPENYNMSRNDLMVLSYVWYKWKRKKKRLYSRNRHQFFDFSGDDKLKEQILYHIDDMEEVTVDTPCWKLAVVLNDQLMFQGDNPLGFTSCPFIPYFWNYEPHLNHYELRVRSLVRSMRSPQFLFNYKVIQNNDIAAATINAGWKRKVGAVANEDNLKKSGQGYDILINEGYELGDCEKIIPSAVPQSDLELAQQMSDLIFQTSGINIENWSGQQDKQISSLTALIKQGANLMVFQKYFDQWDYSDKLLGDKLLQIVLHNWNSEKVALYIGEEPTPFFDSGIFAKYKTMVEEADLTPTQQNLQAQQMIEINQQFGREVFPPSQIIPKLNITGKAEIIQFLEQQEQQMQKMQEEQQHVQHMAEDAKIKELYAKATAHIANAREDHSRAESNLGLYEERLSMIERNRSLSLKEKQEALGKLLENIQLYGAMDTEKRQNELEQTNFQQIMDEEREKQDVEKRTGANKFLAEIMGKGMPMMAAPIDPSGQEGMQEEDPNEMS
jgi:hypothetical protein